MPIIGSWASTTTALLITGLVDHKFSDVIGAYFGASVLLMIVGYTGAFNKLMSTIPNSIIMAMLAGVLLNACAQLLLKAGTNAVGQFEFALENVIPIGLKLAFEPHILGGIACYVVSLVVWIMGLSRVEVSVAYPMLSIGYVINAAAAWYLFGESVSALRMTGIGFIIVGVILVSRSA